jgi:hypothetical protein
MPEYIGLEIGKSAYTEFKMKNGEFEMTEDCIMVGQVTANSKEEAQKLILELEYNIERKFDNLIIKELALKF